MKPARMLAIVAIWTLINQARCYKTPPFVLQPFRQLAHDLQSGPITVRSETTIDIADLYYDGLCQDSHFWVGKGEPSSDGKSVANEFGSIAPLSSYNGANITIQLPKNVTVNDIDYLAIWCSKIEYNVGHVFMYEEGNKSQANDVSRYVGHYVGQFGSADEELRSGPIILVDDKTFYISNLHFIGDDESARFWTGNGSVPSVNGTLVADEDNSYGPLKSYRGESIYVTLPVNITYKDIDYFGMWSINGKFAYGYVNVNKSVTVQAKTHPNITEDGKRIIRVPKCCSLDHMVTPDDCSSTDQQFQVNMSIHISNRTHINESPMSLSRIAYVPYTNNIECEKYYLDPEMDNYSLLTTGHLLYISEKKLVSLDSYCLDLVETKRGFLHTAFVCLPDDMNESKIIHILYAICIIISAVCFLSVPVLYYRIKEHTHLLGVSFMLHSIMMAVAFLCLGISQIVGNPLTCKILGFIFHFTIVAAFTLLNIFFYEIFNHARRKCKSIVGKKYFMLLLAVIIPSIFVLCTIHVDLRPGLLTNYLDTLCSFTSENKWLLYLPIVLSIVVGIAFVVYTGFLFRANQKEDVTNLRLKKYHQISMWIIGLVAVCWGMEVISFYIGHTWEVFDAFHALQGLFAILIIVSVEFRKILTCRFNPGANGPTRVNGKQERIPLQSQTG